MSQIRVNPEYHYLIDFVRPTSSGELPKRNQGPWAPSISGTEAKSFYEELCREAGSDVDKVERARKRIGRFSEHEHQNLHNGSLHFSQKNSDGEETACPKSKQNKVNQRIKDHQKAELFRLAQNGDKDGVKRLLQQGTDVNGIDHFGWTPSMTAAFEGHLHVLRSLVKAGADLTFRNSHGHTALTLAMQTKHTHVVEFIESFQLKGWCGVQSRKEQKKIVKFYCEVCKSEFSDMDQAAHNRSTVHLFNTGAKPKDDSFLIPPTNVGFQLMLKSGWDGDRGLGPSGHGQKFPVKTFLKRDRKGLGNKVAEKARITHFCARDKSAVNSVSRNLRQENVRTLCRMAHRIKERKDRQKAINLRRELS